MRPRTAVLELAVTHRVHVVGLARVPLAPSRRLDVRAHLGIEKHHAGIRPPVTPQPHTGHPGRSRQFAPLEYERAVLPGGAFSLRRNVPDGVRRAPNLAAFEHRPGIAEDEIDVALNVAIHEILPLAARV